MLLRVLCALVVQFFLFYYGYQDCQLEDVITYPEALIGLKVQSSENIRQLFAANQIPPLVNADQVEVRQLQFLRQVAEIVNTKNTLISFNTLMLETKKGRFEL